jgi:NADH:ubiquinone oxidoreductase subunit D
MESLIYHFKIVMGEIPIPVAEIYHPVEGGNGELGFYLVTDGVVIRIDYILEDLVLFTIKPTQT